jgi:hypothetical protein
MTTESNLKDLFHPKQFAILSTFINLEDSWDPEVKDQMSEDAVQKSSHLVDKTGFAITS